MNKIFKVVWSNAKNCYIVVSELAKSRVTADSLCKIVVVASICTSIACDNNILASVYAEETLGTTKQDDEIALGQINRDEDIAIGKDSIVNRVIQDGRPDVTGAGVAIGENTSVLGGGGTAIGQSSKTVGVHALAVGSAAQTFGVSSISIGPSASVGTETSYITAGISIGAHTAVTSDKGIAIGLYSKTSGPSAVSIGESSNAAGSNAIAIGTSSKVEADSTNNPTEGIAIGSTAYTSGFHGVALGPSAKSTGEYAVALGEQSEASGTYSSALGGFSIASGYASTALGFDTEAIGNSSTALGYYSKAYGKYSTALGYFTEANGDRSVASGYRSIASGYSSSALGDHSKAHGDYSTALGTYSEVYGEYGTALGAYSYVQSADNVALGYSSSDSNGVGGYRNKNKNDLVSTASAWTEDWQWGKEISVGDFAGWTASGGTVSVGFSGSERTITNVAAGRIAADSTDAINGSQLYQVAGNLQEQIDEIKENDHYHTVNGKDKENGGSYNADINVDGNTNDSVHNAPDTGMDGSTNASNAVVYSGTGTAPTGDEPVLGGGYVPEENDGNLMIKWDTDENNKQYYDISLNKDLNLDSVNVKNEINVGDKVSIKGDSINVGDITINQDNIDMNNNKIINVQEGTDGTDAVNVNQLNKMEQNITNKVNRLDGKINKVGAGAAALAALHPLDFDPDDKLSFSAGIGHYEDSTAAAIGAFYQPNDDTLFSLGGTVGNGEEMVNMGVTFRFGQNSNQSRSKKAMAKEIIELRTELAELKAMVYSLTNQRFDIYKYAIFPDTPENHWAYDYVAAVAGNGILEGYPSGNFDGSRPMTRYEMAAVVYRLMTMGVQVDQRMIDEFAPELARIKVDTLTNYSDGTPHIQRVRVIEGRG